MSELEDEDETSGFMSCSWLPGIFEENEAIKLKSLLNLREGPFEDGGPTERSKRCTDLLPLYEICCPSQLIKEGSN